MTKIRLCATASGRCVPQLLSRHATDFEVDVNGSTLNLLNNVKLEEEKHPSDLAHLDEESEEIRLEEDLEQDVFVQLRELTPQHLAVRMSFALPVTEAEMEVEWTELPEPNQGDLHYTRYQRYSVTKAAELQLAGLSSVFSTRACGITIGFDAAIQLEAGRQYNDPGSDNAKKSRSQVVQLAPEEPCEVYFGVPCRLKLT